MIPAEYTKNRNEFYKKIYEQKLKLIILMIITFLFNLWYMPDIVSHVSIFQSIFEFILLIIMDLLSIYIVVRYIKTIKTLKNNMLDSIFIEDISEIDSIITKIHKEFTAFIVYENDENYFIELQPFRTFNTTILLIRKPKLANYQYLAEIMRIVANVKMHHDKIVDHPSKYIFKQYLYVDDTTKFK